MRGAVPTCEDRILKPGSQAGEKKKRMVGEERRR